MTDGLTDGPTDTLSYRNEREYLKKVGISTPFPTQRSAKNLGEIEEVFFSTLPWRQVGVCVHFTDQHQSIFIYTFDLEDFFIPVMLISVTIWKRCVNCDVPLSSCLDLSLCKSITKATKPVSWSPSLDKRCETRNRLK